jgi:hypothetical protein
VLTLLSSNYQINERGFYCLLSAQKALTPDLAITTAIAAKRIEFTGVWTNSMKKRQS